MEDYPRDLLEFEARFASEGACRDYLSALRWPEGWSGCGHERAWPKVKAIWNIAGGQGLTVGVLGWRASWPAEQVAGYIVTDHANLALREFRLADKRYWTADAKLLAEMKLDFLPAELAPILEKHWVTKRNFDYREFRLRSKLTKEQMSLLQAAPWNARTTYSLLKSVFASDYSLFTIAQRLAREHPTDLQMLYLRGPDFVQHYAWDLVEPEKYATKPEHLERDRGIVESVYRCVDSFLGEILDSKDSGTTLIVASDHGAEPSPRATGKVRKGRPGEHPKAKGVLFIHGPHVKSDYILNSGNPLDLMPTMAWLLGIPLADDLAGKVLTDAFEQEFVDRQGSTKVATYGPRQTRPGLASSVDQGMLEQLRSLGYIQ